MNNQSLVAGLRPGTWTLTAKLSLASVTLCVLCVAATSVVVGLKSSERARQAAGDQAALAADHAAAQIGGELGRSFAAVLAFGAALEGMKASGHPPSRDQLDDVARQVLTQRAEFIGSYSIWEPNALDGKDAEFVKKTPAYDETGRYIAYWNRGSGQIAVEPLLDYEKEGANDWYAVPRKTLKPALIEPYVYPVGGKDVLMTTMVTPILAGGKFVGAAGSDLPLSGLSERLGALEPVPGGRVSLVSGAGLYVANPDKSRLGKTPDDLPAEVLAAVTRGERHVWDDGQGWAHI